MKTIDDINFNKKKALIRVDFNVPLNEKYEITDDSRILGALSTINKILKDGGSVVLMSHLGRPKDGFSEKYSLKHIVEHLSKLLKTKVIFAEDCIGDKTVAIASKLKAGEVLLLENLRFHKEEEKGDEVFAKKLSVLGDVYVNEAFGTAHRAHASTTIVAKFFPKEKCIGYLMRDEIRSINKVIDDPEKPVTAIIGGAKVSDKVLIIENLLDKVDNLLIGGGMAYTFISAMGGKIGNSLVENERKELALELIEKAKRKNVRILLPIDSVVADSFKAEAKTEIYYSDNIPDNWMGLDIGPKAVDAYTAVILESKTILWNGPMGVFEWENFQNGSKSVALAIAKATAKGAFSLIGGGDSVSAIHLFKLSDEVSYISTGGGAMLEFLEGKELPGIKAISN